MEINKLNPSENVQNIKKTQVNKGIQKATENNTLKKDVIDVKANTSEYKEIYTKVIDIINKTPDVREDKVASIKANLDSYNNLSDAKLTEIAEKILSDLTGQA